MDKIFYTEEDMEFLLDWRDKHIDYVHQCVCPIRAIRIISKVNGIAMTCVRDGDTIKVNVTLDERPYGKLIVHILPSGFYEVDDKTSKILDMEAIQSIMTTYASTMALLAYGNETTKPSKRTIHKSEDKQKSTKKSNKKKHNKSKSNGITYVLRRDSTDAVIIPHGKHRSPQGTFNVRGHFRHYKDGKIIWIEEYSKGRGNKKSKTYKL